MRDARKYAGRTVLAVALCSMVALAGCGDDDDSSPTGPTGVNTDVSGVIANNHGHAALITAAQIADGRAITIDIRGTADHNHLLDLTNDDIVRLRQRQRVERDASANNTHTHRVTFN
jgi:hypothetical protein